MTVKSKNKLIANIIITAAVFALAVFYLTRSKTVTAESVAKISFWQYAAVFVFTVFGLVLYALVDFFVYCTFTREMPFGKCFLNTLSGNLGSNVTPYKSAHFPLMAYYRYTAGIKASEAVTGLIKCQIVYSITSFAVYLVLLVALLFAGSRIVFEGVSVPLWAVVAVGFTFHSAVLAAILVLSFCVPLQKRVLKLWGRLLLKLKKIDSEEEYLARKEEWFAAYRTEISYILKNFAKYLLPCFVYAVFMLVSGSVQYCAWLVFTGNAFSAGDMFAFYTLCLASAYVTNIVPVPGGVGTAEVLFSLVYSVVIPDPVIGSVLVLWRVGSYYIVTVLEAIIVPTVLFVNRRKYGERASDGSEKTENPEAMSQDGEEIKEKDE